MVMNILAMSKAGEYLAKVCVNIYQGSGVLQNEGHNSVNIYQPSHQKMVS